MSVPQPYVEATLKEALRMHPAAPMVARVLDADVPTSPGGPVLRAGSAAAVWIHAVHRDPSAWVRAHRLPPAIAASGDFPRFAPCAGEAAASRLRASV